MSTKEEIRQIDWPDDYNRTNPDDRESYPGELSVSHKQAFESIVDELHRWGKTDVEIETAGTHYANDPNIPHKSADPDNVGVVAYYRDLEAHSSEQSAVACDCWETQRENARAIALWVRRIRLADRCGIETARDIDEVAQLPPADDEAIAAPPVQSDNSDPLEGEEPHEVLGIAPDAPNRLVTVAYQEAVKGAHPDHGGSRTEMERIEAAREAMLDAE